MSYESICQDKNIVMHCLTLKCLTICQDKYIVLLCLTFQMNNKNPQVSLWVIILFQSCFNIFGSNGSSSYSSSFRMMPEL